MRTIMTYTLMLLVITSVIACNSDQKEKTTVSETDLDASNDNAVIASTLPLEVQNNGHYEIQGTIANAAGRVVFLQELPQAKPGGGYYSMNQLANDTIGPDGSFSLSGQVSEPQITVLALDNQHVIYLYLNGGQMTVSSDYNNFANYTVEGSPNSLKVKQLINSILTTKQQINQAQKQAKQALNAGKSKEEVEALYDQVGRIHDQQNNYIRNLIETTENPVLALFAADILDISTEFDYVKKVYQRMRQETPQSRYTARLGEKIAHQEQFIGKEAPELDLPNPNGQNMKLSDLRGQVVLLDFWASWCRPCRDENPNVVRIYDKYKDNGFTIYSVSLDKAKDKWIQAIDKDNLKWDYHVSELKGWQAATNRLYSVKSIPATFLIDEEGKIVAKNLRGYMLEKKIKELVD